MLLRDARTRARATASLRDGVRLQQNGGWGAGARLHVRVCPTLRAGTVCARVPDGARVGCI